MKIIINMGNFKNKGAEAMIYSTCQIVKNVFKNPEIVVVASDRKRNKDFKVVDVQYFKGTIKLLVKSLIKSIPFLKRFVFDDVLQEFEESDMVINIGGFVLSDKMYLKTNINYFLFFLLFKLLKKKHIIFPQDMGPFNSKFKGFLASLVVEFSDLVIVRSDVSKMHLEKLGIKKKIYVCPDIAFNFEPSPQNKAKLILEENCIKSGKFICIIPNRRIYEKNEKYIDFLSKFSDYIVSNFNVNIIYLPHEIRNGKCDDYTVIEEIFLRIIRTDKVFKLSDTYSSSEIKGIIGLAAMLISSRYHAVVAGISMRVPTIVVGWAHKYMELMKLVEMDEFVYDFENIDDEAFTDKINKLWINKDSIKKYLEKMLPKIEREAKYPGILLKKYGNG